MPATQQLYSALWALGIGAVFALAIWLIVSNAWYRHATENRIPDTDVKPTPIGMVEEYPEGLAEAHGGPTLFLKVLIGAFVVWTVGYVAFFLRGQL
jgi:hypothetical protein